ncbi:MAG: hypothetical protein H0X33_11440 [Taibaiella sp.]|nr:hypothetical protein [Taibaiella sp.]
MATEDALYSDGTRYRPLVIAFREIIDSLSAVKDVLFLGTGIGSGAAILDKLGHTPEYTLVEIDEAVLEMALEIMPPARLALTIPVCANAEEYIKNAVLKYDLVVVDIFKGRMVPAFVMEIDFLKQIRNTTNQGGISIINYIVADDREWQVQLQKIQGVFPGCKIIKSGINRIVISQKLPA